MTRSHHLKAGLFACSMGLYGCVDADPAGLAEAADVELQAAEDQAAHAGRLGRVHVVLEHELAPALPEPEGDQGPVGVRVTARFVAYRGLDEAQVRDRAGLAELATERVPVDRCVPTRAPQGSGPGARAVDRELTLLDAGELEVAVGDVSYGVPMSLVPDLLPYMSGVEYATEDTLPPELLEDELRVTVRAEGGPDGEVPAFTQRGEVPALPELGVQREPGGTLSLAWIPAEQPSPLVLQIGAGGTGGLTCVLADDGDAWIDLRDAPSLDADAELDVQVSRFSRRPLAGSGLPGAELVVEARDTVTLAARASE